ncbi:MAG: cyclic nucleotide-binding domain-containing protein, partial [Ignavibacteria bacterium]|nr:cyclic nucleotide-binding domain-containing protein [Ignavibacteria bacterium]
TLHPGDFFGELNVLAEGVRTANATAIKNSKVLVIFRPDLISIIEKDHSLGIKILFGFLKVLTEKIKNLNTDYMNLYELTMSENKTQKGG